MIITGINESRTNQQHKRLYQQYLTRADGVLRGMQAAVKVISDNRSALLWR